MDATENVREPYKGLNNQHVSLQSIGFPNLNEVLDQCLRIVEESKHRKLERWSLIAGTGGAGIGQLLGTAIPDTAGSLALYGGLAVEIAGRKLLISYEDSLLNSDGGAFGTSKVEGQRCTSD